MSVEFPRILSYSAHIMGRLARIVVPDTPHHITQRGNRRQQIFFLDTDYSSYKNMLASACTSFGIDIWAYCLMPNHIHLIATPSNPNALAYGIGQAHMMYSAAINRRNSWSGHLWQGRFFSVPLNETHLLSAVRYVELNPVRAGLIAGA